MTVEKRDKLNEAIEWMRLRETRNIVTHEYPFVTDEIIPGEQSSPPWPSASAIYFADLFFNRKFARKK